MKFVNYKTVFGAIFVVIALVFLTNSAKGLVEFHSNGSFVKELENELSDKKGENKFLKEQVKHVKTDKFIENEARLKLGYVMPNEVVVQEEIKSDTTSKINEVLLKPNWQLWTELFF